MTWNKTLTELTYQLADLYSDSGEARLVVGRAVFEVTDIKFDQNVRNYWQHVLTYANGIDTGARNHDSIIRLLETITSPRERGKKDEFLKSVLNNYRTGNLSDGKGLAVNADWRKPVLSDRLFVLDRSSVYEKLALLADDNALEKVILIRGGKGSGKSHCRFLFQEKAKQAGADFKYMAGSKVGTARQAIDQLFTHYNKMSEVPPIESTPDAWYKKVSLKLKEIAATHMPETERRPLWIAMDNMGHTELGSDVRDFFDQFALNMDTENFYKWFRLILINYPDKIPTEWTQEFWTDTDSPIDEKDVQPQHVADCLLAWANTNNRLIPPDDLKAWSEKLITTVDTYQSVSGEDPLPRLRRIHDELARKIKDLKAQPL